MDKIKGDDLMPSVNNLISIINDRKGLAPANRYRVLFVPPLIIRGDYNINHVDALCESTSLPGKQITTIDAPLYAYRQSTKYPNGYTFEDITFSFYLTNDFYIRKIFDRWLDQIVTPSYLIKYDKDYKVDIEIQQLDQNDKKIYAVRLIKAFPITMNSNDLSNGATSEPQKLSVTMTFEDWRPIQ